jgi:hypothetical protein
MELDEDWMDESAQVIHNAWTISKEDYMKEGVALHILIYQQKHGIYPMEWKTYPETRPYPLKSCNLCGPHCAYTPKSKAPAPTCHYGSVTLEDPEQTTIDQEFSNLKGKR